MNQIFRRCLWLVPLALTCVPLRAVDSLTWDAKRERVSASIEAWPLDILLQKISAATGWEVFVEPGSAFMPSAKFSELTMGDALRSLLGNLSFALVPQTNASAQLFVFHTSAQAATQRVITVPLGRHMDTSKPIPNQLVVTVKECEDINTLAGKIGAKVIGRLGNTDTYLLEFSDDAATQAARASLDKDTCVASVDNNYAMNEPPQGADLTGVSTPSMALNATPLGNGNPVTVGLIDTGFDPSDYCGLSKFVSPAISVANGTSGGGLAHGAAMAATIVRVSGGKAKILPVNVYGTNSTTSTFYVASGIAQAVNAGANIINLSLGSEGDTPYLHRVITTASGQGVVFFAAAGNEPVTTPTYPAAYPEVTAVTAGYKNGDVASYANHGSFVDVVAPGGSVVCYNGSSWMVAGTSAATAYASGLAATAAGSGLNAAQITKVVDDTLAKPKTP